MKNRLMLLNALILCVCALLLCGTVLAEGTQTYPITVHDDAVNLYGAKMYSYDDTGKAVTELDCASSLDRNEVAAGDTVTLTANLCPGAKPSRPNTPMN